MLKQSRRTDANAKRLIRIRSVALPFERIQNEISLPPFERLEFKGAVQNYSVLARNSMEFNWLFEIDANVGRDIHVRSLIHPTLRNISFYSPSHCRLIGSLCKRIYIPLLIPEASLTVLVV